MGGGILTWMTGGDVETSWAGCLFSKKHFSGKQIGAVEGWSCDTMVTGVCWCGSGFDVFSLANGEAT
jgi:hypothetical protein